MMTTTERSAKWRLDNPERAREHQLAYRARNPGLAASRSRARRAMDPDREREYQRSWHAAHPGANAAYGRKYRETYPDRVAERRFTAYGMTSAEYASMLADQGGRCAICGATETAQDRHSGKVQPLVIDHDHSSGLVRGLLCTRCNKGLGHFGDDPETMRSAITYVASKA